jgi:hypothetical protein
LAPKAEWSTVDYSQWGVPVHDNRLLFKFLILEGAQAGLSWDTILKKRENYRRTFDNFDPAIVARYGQKKRKGVGGIRPALRPSHVERRFDDETQHLPRIHATHGQPPRRSRLLLLPRSAAGLPRGGLVGTALVRNIAWIRS